MDDILDLIEDFIEELPNYAAKCKMDKAFKDLDEM